MTNEIRKSMVRVFFSNGTELNYFNDKFDLKIGDMVFVEGRYEGQPGRVIKVEYNFRIKVVDYKKVVSVADLDIHGTFHSNKFNHMTFDKDALPSEKARTWFFPPINEEEEIAIGHDDDVIPLDEYLVVRTSKGVPERGVEYFNDRRVKYLELDGTKGYAIVEGTQMYEVAFTYSEGLISEIVCTCPYVGHCKHEIAVMLQLQDCIEFAEMNYADEYRDSGYFALIDKYCLYNLVINRPDAGDLTL